MAEVKLRLKLITAGVVLSTSVVSAQQAPRPAAAEMPKADSSESAQNPASAAKTRVYGVVLDGRQEPLANATVRLRNLDVTKVEQTGTTNKVGEFSFAARPNVMYVVEVVDHEGRTLAVGDVVSVTADEAAEAIVVVPSSLPKAAGIFGETAATVLAAVAGTGLTVLDPALPKVSPEK
jgi:hypothetical protein